MKLTNLFIRDFFSYKRPHGSDTERQWIERFIIPALGDAWWQDAAGNIHYDNRDTGSRTLFVSHTDTVHRQAGRQKVTVGKNNVLRINDPKQTNCLGADDGAGALVLLALIEAGVPAYYIFTRGEEIGGIGAEHLVKHHADLLAEFDRAIAFDRRGTSSVITHQGWGRCCSDTFANGLSDALSNDVLMYAPDDTGVYTDTAEFVGIIPECTNISVGYVREHSTDETQDLTHLRDLINCVVGIDWEALPTERDPSVDEREMCDDRWGGSVYGDHHALYGVGSKLNGYSDYNSQVYELCERAMGGEPDELIYHMCSVLNPADPDELYEHVWDMKLTETALKNCIREIDYATDDEAVDDALIDLYYAAVHGDVCQ